MRRNIAFKMIDTIIIVSCVFLISFLQGNLKLTSGDREPNIPLDLIASEEPNYFILPAIFSFSATNLDVREFALKVGVITSVLVGLVATKTSADKKQEFLREAGSGSNVNAYLLGLNITSSFEHGAQIILCAVVCLHLRNSAAHPAITFVNFILLGWVTVSWSLFFPVFASPRNVVLMTGCFNTLNSICFGGALGPVLYSDIYTNDFLAVFSGLFSPCRFFIEMMVVSENRALPPQAGYTIEMDEAVNFPLEYNMFNYSGSLMAQNDFPAVTEQSYNGWLWPVLPAFLVGLTVRIGTALVINCANRDMQAKVPFRQEFRSSPRFRNTILGISATFLIFLVLTILAILN